MCPAAFTQVKLPAQGADSGGESANSQVGSMDAGEETAQVFLVKRGAVQDSPTTSGEVPDGLVGSVEVGVLCQLADRKTLADSLESTGFQDAGIRLIKAWAEGVCETERGLFFFLAGEDERR